VRALLALLVLLAAVPAAAADKAPTTLAVPGSLHAGSADVALSGSGPIAVAAVEAGTVDVWTHGSGWSERRLPSVKPTAVAVTFAADGKPSVAYAAADGVWVAAPTPKRLATGTVDGVQTALLGSGQTAVAATTRAGKRDRLRLFVGHGAAWAAYDLGAVGRGPVQVAPWGARGLALLYSDTTGELLVETRSSPGVFAQRLRLGVDNGLGALALGHDGALHLLFGGSVKKDRVLEYGTLSESSGFASRTLIDNLQCDIYVVGVGFLGTSARLVYGYGCDIGWGLYTETGKLAYSPFGHGDENQGPAIAESTAAGQVGVLALEAKRGLEVQLFRQ
jgi:hypothetical protein